MVKSVPSLGGGTKRVTKIALTLLLVVVCISHIVVQLSTKGYYLTQPFNSTNKGTNKQPFPPQCSADDLEIVSYQLPGFAAMTYATGCPDAVWLTEQYRKAAERRKLFLWGVIRPWML